VKSAELYLHLSRLNKGSNNDESRWKASAGKALQRAEKIKALSERSDRVSGLKLAPSRDPSNTSSELRLTPIGIDHFSRRTLVYFLRRKKANCDKKPEEQFYVLKKGGSVNGLVFPLWDEPLPVLSGLSSISQYQFVVPCFNMRCVTQRN